MFTPSDIKDLLANAYYDAARSESNMHVVTEILEELREALAIEKEAYKIWNRINLQMGRSVHNTFRLELLSSVRAQFYRYCISNYRS